MRLRQGSYYYIIGVFLMLLSGGAATASVLSGLRYRAEFPVANELLSEYGNALVGQRRLLWVTGIFGFFAVIFAGYFFFTALKRNNIVLPMRVIGTGMVVCSVIMAVMLISEGGHYGEPSEIVARYLRVPSTAALGVSLICLSFGTKNSRMPSIFFGAMCGYGAFTGFGFEKLFVSDPAGITDTDLRGYCSLLLFAVSFSLFYSGVCFCVGSCERRVGKPKKFEFAD